MGTVDRKGGEAERSAKREPTAVPASQQPMALPQGPVELLGNRAMLHLLRSGRLQRKPRLSEPGDPLEHQADRAAEAVIAGSVREKSPRLSREAPEVQREPLSPEEELTSEPGAPGRASMLAPPAPPPSDESPPGAPPVRQLLSGLGTGEPLPRITRALMESRFGASFDDVRIHAGAPAAGAAAAVSAKAFTVGQDIVFGEHQYDPGTLEGRRLLAHELAHTLQQRGGAGAREPVTLDHAAEHDAESAAEQVEAGGAAVVRERAGQGIQRQSLDGEPQISTTRPSVTGSRFQAGEKDAFAVYVEGQRVASGHTSIGIGGVFRHPSSWESVTRTLTISVYYGPWGGFWPDPNLQSVANSLGITIALHPFQKWAPSGEPDDEEGYTPGPPVVVFPGKEAPPKPPPKPPKPAPKPPPPKLSPTPEPPSPETPGVKPPGQEPADEPRQVKPSSPADTSPGGRVRSALKQEPAKAAELAPQLSDLEQETLSLAERTQLLDALAKHRVGDELDINSIKRLLDNTPDRDAADLYARLLEDGGKLVRQLQEHAVGTMALELEMALRRLQKRGQYGLTPKEGFVRRVVGIDGKAAYLNEAQIQKMIADAPKTLERGFKDIEERAKWGKQTQKSVLGDYQLDVESWGDIWDRPASLIGIFSDIWGDTHAPSSRVWDQPQRYVKAGREALAKGNTKEAAEYFRLAQGEIDHVEQQWKTYTGETIVGAEKLTEDIKIAATTAIVVASAGYAAPAVYGGSLALIGGEGTVVATAGLGTKAGATLLTATTLGFWGGLEGGAVRAGLGKVSGAPSTSEEFWKGVQTGAPAGFAAGISYGGMATMGLLGKMPVTWGNVGRMGLIHGVSGASSGGLGTFLQGGSAGDIAKASARDFGFGFVGGAAGAKLQPWLGSSPWRNRLYQTATGGLLPATGIWLMGGSREDMYRAALTGSMTGFMTSFAGMPEASGKPRVPGAPQFGRWARTRIAAGMMRFGVGYQDAWLGGAPYIPNRPRPTMVLEVGGQPVQPRGPTLPGDQLPYRVRFGAPPTHAQPPENPYDVAAWKAYYEQNPHVGRSVGAASVDDPNVAPPVEPQVSEVGATPAVASGEGSKNVVRELQPPSGPRKLGQGPAHLLEAEIENLPPAQKPQVVTVSIPQEQGVAKQVKEHATKVGVPPHGANQSGVTSKDPGHTVTLGREASYRGQRSAQVLSQLSEILRAAAIASGRNPVEVQVGYGRRQDGSVEVFVSTNNRQTQEWLSQVLEDPKALFRLAVKGGDAHVQDTALKLLRRKAQQEQRLARGPEDPQDLRRADEIARKALSGDLTVVVNPHSRHAEQNISQHLHGSDKYMLVEIRGTKIRCAGCSAELGPDLLISGTPVSGRIFPSQASPENMAAVLDKVSRGEWWLLAPGASADRPLSTSVPAPEGGAPEVVVPKLKPPPADLFDLLEEK